MKKQAKVRMLSEKLTTRVTLSRLLAEDEEKGCCLITTNDGTSQFPTTLRGCKAIARSLGGTWDFNPGEVCESSD